MAKIKVRPRPGALSTLLKEKRLTQMDAHTTTRVDRKTLLKIDRGEEVKLETLQKVATKLRVTQEYFCTPLVGLVADDDDVVSALEPGNIMLRKLDVERLRQLLEGTPRIRWQLNAQVRGDAVRTCLEELEEAVKNLKMDVEIGPDTGYEDHDADSLRFQLYRLKTSENVATVLARLAEHRLAVLGAEYLFWVQSFGGDIFGPPGLPDVVPVYGSGRIVVLSVEPLGTQSRRVQVSLGSVPPVSVAPNGSTVIYVGFQRLVADEEGRYIPWSAPVLNSGLFT